jgi:hypothetical protein
MTAPEGPFDLIWCAGAVYFLGIEHALARVAHGAGAGRGHRVFGTVPLHRDAIAGGAGVLGQ